MSTGAESPRPNLIASVNWQLSNGYVLMLTSFDCFGSTDREKRGARCGKELRTRPEGLLSG